MLVLWLLSRILILFGVRYFVRNWQKISAHGYFHLWQNEIPAHFYLYSQQILCQHKVAISSHNNWYWSHLSSSQFPCSFLSYNCIKTRRFSVHNNWLQYSIGMNVKIRGYTASNRCQSDLMELFHAMHRKFPTVLEKLYWKTSVLYHSLLWLRWHMQGLIFYRKDL